MDEVELEGGVEFPQWSIVGLTVDQGLGGIADAFGQHRHGLGQHVGGVDDMADAVAEDAGPAGAPVIERFLGIRPVELFAQRGGEAVDLERGIAAVPAEHAERGHVALFLMEVGERDFATIVFSPEGGDEEQVLGVPGRAVGLVGRGAFLHHEVGKDAAEDDDGELLTVELNKEDTPRLLGIEWAELTDGLDLGRIGRLEPEFIGLVIEREIFDIVAFERPAKFVLQVADELFEGANEVEIRGHERLGL